VFIGDLETPENNEWMLGFWGSGEGSKYFESKNWFKAF
jgi:hypothetical protein